MKRHRRGRTTCGGTAPLWWTSSTASSSPRWSARLADTSVPASTPLTSCPCRSPWTAQCTWRSRVRERPAQRRLKKKTFFCALIEKLKWAAFSWCCLHSHKAGWDHSHPIRLKIEHGREVHGTEEAAEWTVQSETWADSAGWGPHLQHQGSASFFHSLSWSNWPKLHCFGEHVETDLNRNRQCGWNSNTSTTTSQTTKTTWGGIVSYSNTRTKKVSVKKNLDE